MVHVRRARTDDAAAMRAAHLAAVRTTSRSHYAEADVAAWAARIGEEAYDDDFARRDVVVAEEAGRVVGFGVLDAGDAEIRAIYVHPEAGRRGVGRRLLAALETIGRLRGLGGLRLESSLNAVPLYAGAGWRRGAGTRRTFPGGRDIRCVEMTKALAPLRLDVREEHDGDAAAIGAVERAAFGQPGEAALVEGLRAAGALAVSLVAVLDDVIVGHAALSPVEVAGGRRVLGLGPVAVLPACQACAVGSRLVEEGLARAGERGALAVVVLGDPAYYARFGFVPASRFGIRYPGPVPDEAFMAAELVPDALAEAAGAVRYHPAFEAVVPTPR